MGFQTTLVEKKGQMDIITLTIHKSLVLLVPNWLPD
jgi:hypothetical protein